MSRFLSVSCVVFAAVLFTAERAEAQRVPNLNRRPTVSPLINLFNSNQGGVNNYFSFVRPLQQQQRLNQQQLNQSARLQQQLNRPGQFGGGGPITLGPQLGGQQSMLRQAPQGVGAPSTAATFLNYSHYYPPQRLRQRQR